MIHFTCDACQRTIDSENESRYVVRLEVYEALGDTADTNCEEADHLQEIEDIIERIDELNETQLDDDLYKQVRYDLCPDCRKRFMQNPLGKVNPARFGFSNN